MSVERYQNLVIGSGVGGKLIGWTLARRGQKTVVVERSMIGGACPNVACLPSKNVIHRAKAVSLVDPHRGLGVDHRTATSRYAGGGPSQAEDGRRSGRDPFSKVQGQRCRAGHGGSAVRRA